MRRRSIAAAIGLSAALALGAVAPARAAAAGTPIEISADTFTVQQDNHHATFSGAVVIKRLDLVMQADTVLVVYGDGGQNDIDSLTADGNVRVQTSTQKARGDHATFDPDTQLIRLTGNVKVSNAQGELNGPELVIDLKQNTSVFKGNKGGRVTGVFTPQ